MNCNCISEMEKKLAEKYARDLGVDAKAECQAVAFTFGASVDLQHKTDFKVTADKPGFRRGKVVAVMVSYCPFCGKATKREPEHAA